MKLAANSLSLIFFALVILTFPAYSQVAPGTPAKKPVPPANAPFTYAQPMPYAKAFTFAKDCADKFLSGNAAPFWDDMTPEMQQALGNDRTKWEQAAVGIPSQLGHVTQTMNERMLPAMDLQNYTRLIRTDAMPAPLVIIVAVTPEGKIGGIAARPLINPAESKFLEYKDKNTYRFPLNGEWTVYQGGRTTYDNYHAAYPDERFALDIIAFRHGSMYSDGASSLDTFYGFGQPVVAAAAGKVVSAADEYPDNQINKPASSTPKQGNNVVIDAGNGEFMMYAHLKRGSVLVRAGDTVKAGQPIGAVGNSGNSPLPHLHFHVQNSPTWFQGEGLPVVFHDATVNGKRQSEFEPVRGDVVKAD